MGKYTGQYCFLRFRSGRLEVAFALSAAQRWHEQFERGILFSFELTLPEGEGPHPD
jgi:hypothetical protein